ncbi:hypothetical protein LCGC14_2133990 [marine sediment metagenome]|uniref:Uncharacterized protein n=1 Tax=marine sediment metagenome TaxID=412755 RepID=A0A0F9GDK3_9ZZZZ
MMFSLIRNAVFKHRLQARADKMAEEAGHRVATLYGQNLHYDILAEVAQILQEKQYDMGREYYD